MTSTSIAQRICILNLYIQCCGSSIHVNCYSMIRKSPIHPKSNPGVDDSIKSPKSSESAFFPSSNTGAVCPTKAHLSPLVVSFADETAISFAGSNVSYPRPSVVEIHSSEFRIPSNELIKRFTNRGPDQEREHHIQSGRTNPSSNLLGRHVLSQPTQPHPRERPKALIPSPQIRRLWHIFNQ